MKPLSSVKVVQNLTSMIGALNRFMSIAADKYLTIFKLLRKINNFEWTEERQQAFKELKKYLSSPPFLARPRPKDKLLLSLVTSNIALSTVLTKEETR